MVLKARKYDIDMKMPLVKRAEVLATILHKGQTRSDGSPYIIHPKEVAKLIDIHNGSDEEKAAAWLHDVGEDQYYDGIYDDISFYVSKEVSKLVLWLTDISTKAHGPRVVRKRLNNCALALAPIKAKNVKVCDIISNTKDIRETNPQFAKVYLVEKAGTLTTALYDANPMLLDKAWAIIRGE